MLVELKCTEQEELSTDITLRFVQLNFCILLLKIVLSAAFFKKNAVSQGGREIEDKRNIHSTNSLCSKVRR